MRLDAFDAPRRGLPEGGGTAPAGSPERRRRAADAAEDSERGGRDFDEIRASQYLISGEEGEAEAAELAVAVDLAGEAWSGRDVRRRRSRRRGRESREGGCGVFFHKGP